MAEAAQATTPARAAPAPKAVFEHALVTWITAFVFELLALATLAGAAGTARLLAFLALHAIASAAAAFAVALLFPVALRRPRRLLWALLFGLNFFVPVIGLVTTVVGAVGGTLFPRLLAPNFFARVSSPEYTPDRAHDPSRMRGGGARARLRDRNLAPTRRVEALMALGATPSPATGPLLREMLADPVDDLRLLAYGLLDRREKEISERLLRERAVMAELTDPVEQRASAARVAQLFWELVYQDLVSGDMATYALDQARNHALLAVESRGAGRATAGAWLLLARVGLRREKLEGVEEALTAAQENGLPRAAIVPYLAELRYLQGRHREIPTLMFELGRQPAAGPMAALQQYWAA